MRHYYARQRNDGRWEFAGALPIGYCAEYKEWGEEEKKKFGEVYVEHIIEEQKSYAFKHKHHTDGHETEEEACECYKQFVLDNSMRIVESNSQQNRCRVCNAWTCKYVTIGDTTMMSLCDEHCNREEIEKLYHAPSDIWVS